MVLSILRWVLFIPLSFLGVLVANFVLIALNQWTIGSYIGLEPSDFMYKLWINSVLGYLLPLVFQIITFYVVPNNKKQVLKIVSVILIIFFSLSVILTILSGDYWSTLFSIVGIGGAVMGLKTLSNMKENKEGSEAEKTSIDEHKFLEENLPEITREMELDEKIKNIKDIKYFFAHRALRELAMYDNDRFSDFLSMYNTVGKPNPFRLLFARFDVNKTVKLKEDELIPIVRRVDTRYLTMFKLPKPTRETHALYVGFIAPNPRYYTLELNSEGGFYLCSYDYDEKRSIHGTVDETSIEAFYEAIKEESLK